MLWPFPSGNHSFYPTYPLLYLIVMEAENSEPEVTVEKLYAQIGKLKVNLNFLKKVQINWGYPRANGGHQTKAMFTGSALTMRITVHSSQFIVIRAKT
jgi:hypothetical protein